MNALLTRVALGALLLACSVTALADIPRPDGNPRRPAPPPPAEFSTRFSISPDVRATEARLVIPRAVWQELRTQFDGGGQTANTAGSLRLGNTQTVLAGIFLSLACACGGLWLVRARRADGRAARVAFGLLLVASGGAAAGAAYANAGPPPVARSLTSRILIPEAQPYGVWGEVKIEIVDDSGPVRLVLPTGKDRGRE
ncbi:MAG TPA: hypothetical protein VF546_20310 [Pyrinomonadaceae bacterium]|jgi:hypothetical protein